ncbi:SprT-like domain-containing protein [Nocardioides sp. AN3]
MDLEDASTLARQLMDQHGLSGWRLELDRAKRRAGICRHRDKVIGLSAPITKLHPETEVRDTILHEIAHALAGPRAGHGPTWVATARRIGCSAERCVSEDAPAVPGAWVGICQEGHEVDRHRRPERVLLCARCSTRPTGERVFEWFHRGRPAPLHPNYVAELRGILEGRRLVRLAVGSRARIIAPGDFKGRVGTVVKTGRTRYHVKVREGVLMVLHAGVEPA